MDRTSRGVVACPQCACWSKPGDLDGTCRRHAPKTSDTIDEVARWPLTHRTDQCGEGIPAKAFMRPAVTCRTCIYWRHKDGGIVPYNGRDQPPRWWLEAGHCTSFAPTPSVELGHRGFWRATHVSDGCFDGETDESVA